MSSRLIQARYNWGDIDWKLGGPIALRLYRMGVFVTWNSMKDGAFDVYGQFFEENGEKRGSEFQVNDVTAGEQSLNLRLLRLMTVY